MLPIVAVEAIMTSNFCGRRRWGGGGGGEVTKACEQGYTIMT